MDKDNTELLISKLSSASSSDVDSSISKLTSLFISDRIFIPRYTQKINIYQILIDIYLNKGIQNKTSMNLLKLLDIILHNINCDKSVFNYVYQSLSKFYFDQSKITNAIIVKYINLLKHLYNNGRDIDKEHHKKLPKNYFFFHNNGAMTYKLPKELTINEGITIIMWFRVSKLSSDTNAKIITLTKSNDAIFVLSTNKKSFALHQSSTKLKMDTDIPFTSNEYIMLSFSVRSHNIVLWISNNENKEYEYNINYTNNDIDAITLFGNSIAETSTVVLLNKYITKKEIGFDYLHKKFPFGITRSSKIESLIRMIPIDTIHTVSIPTYYTSDTNIVDDYFSHISANLTGNSGIHIYSNLPKKISNVGGMKSILPIVEMIYTAETKGIIKMTNEVLYDYFDMVETILTERKNNIKEAEDINVFQIISLFIERFPSEIFDMNLMNKFIDIKNTILSHSKTLYQVFFENIMLNEKIYYKFKTEVQSELWNDISKQFGGQDIEGILSLMPMSKICLLLKYYDEKRYFEYCCDEHKNAFIYSVNSRTMVPNFKSKTKTLIELVQNILNKVDISKSNEPLTLFQILCLDISPCLAKIVIQIFIGLFTNKNLYLKFKAGELADNSKSNFDDIVINLLSRCLPDVKSDVLHLIAVAKKNKKLDDDFIDGIYHNINLSDAFYINRIIDDKNTNEYNNTIKNLALHCTKYIKSNIECNHCDNEKTCIISQSYLSSNHIKIYNTLFELLLNKPKASYSNKEDLKLSENDNIFNERIIEVIINYISYINVKDLTHKLCRDLRSLFTKNYNNCYILYSNKILYNFTISNMYQRYKSSDSIDKEIFDDCKEINTKIFINTILQDRKIKKVLQSYPTMSLNNLLTWGYNIRKNNNNKELIYEFIDEIIKEYFTLLKSNMGNENSIDGNVYQNMLTMFSIAIDYSTLFHSDDGIFDFKCGEYVPHCFIENIKLKENRWKDFDLLNEIYSCFNYIWANEEIKKFCDNGINSENIIERNEAIMRSLIFNKDNKNLYIKSLSILDYVFISNYNLKLSKCVLIFLSIVIHLNNKNNDRQFASKWINELKNFTLFYIIASNNIWDINKIENLYQHVQYDSACIALYSLSFILDELSREDNSDVYNDTLKQAFREIFSFIVAFIDSINDSTEKSKRFSFRKFFDKSSFRKMLLESSLYLTFSSEHINYSAFKLSSYSSVPDVFIASPDINTDISSHILKARVNHDCINSFFALSEYVEKILQRKKNYIVLTSLMSPIKKNLSRSDKIVKLIPKFQITVSKYSTGSFMIIKEKRNLYKKIKKELFLWKGMWSNSDELYNNKYKMKVLNHYTKFYSRPLLIPILDIDYYVPSFTNFKTEKMFKSTSTKKIALDIDALLKTNSVDTTYIVNTDPNSNDMNYLNYIDYKSDKMIYKLNLNFTKKIFLSKEEDFMKFFSEIRSLSKSEAMRKYENFYQCCFVKPSHHIKGVLFVNESTVTFRVFINQIKANNIISDEDFDNEEKNKVQFRMYDDGFDLERNTCFGSYFVYHDKDKDALTFTMPYEQMIYLFRRRYYQRNVAIEFFSKNHKSYYFAFKNEKDREGCIKDILSHFKDNEMKKIKIDLCKNKDSYKNIIGYETTKKTFLSLSKKKKLSHIIKKWQSYKISNFEFLMLLNLYSNRSFSDLSQYPVFPWVISNYETSNLVFPKDFRELSLPMGMMTLSPSGESRKETYIENFETIAEDQNEEGQPAQIPFYFGSHYSNPIYVVHYLTRLFPYSHISIELQGDKFDKADRLFLNVGNSFNCAASSKGDVRELIPEFYYLPEMFVNVNELNLGSTQEGASVDNAICPVWSRGDPYRFVCMMRKWIESEEVSKIINEWMDLIFGYKQRGKDAISAFNVFFPDSYELDLEKMKRDEKVVKLKMVEFGLTPKQISTVEFPVKKKENQIKKFVDSHIVNYRCAPLNVKTNGYGKNVKYRNLLSFKVIDNNEKLIAIYRDEDDIKMFKFPNFNINNINNAILKSTNSYIAPSSNNNMVLKSSKTISGKNNMNTMKFALTQSEIKSTKKYNYLGKINSFYTNELNKIPIVYIPSSSSSLTVIQGGFYDSKLLLITIDTSHSENTDNANHITYKSVYISKSPYPITSLCIMKMPHNKKDIFILTGNLIGDITLLSFNSNSLTYPLNIVHSFINNTSAITDVVYSNTMNIFASASYDGFIDLYTIPSFRLFRSIKHHSAIDNIFISSSPLAAIVAISESEMKTYSINGKELCTITEANGIKSAKMLTDETFCDSIVYISGRKLMIRTLPYLEVKSEISLTIRDAEVIYVDNEMRVCFVGNMQGSEWVYVVNKDIDIK